MITLGDINGISDVWTFEGTVTDNGNSVAGLKVNFGGVLARYHLTATVEANGTYDCTEELRNIRAGSATAQTHNAAGMASNVAMTFVDPRNVGSTAERLLDFSPAVDTGGPGATISTVAARPAPRATADRPSTRRSTARKALPPTARETCSSPTLTITSSARSTPPRHDHTVAGNGVCGYAGNGGPATSAELDVPTGIAVDSAGDLFIADSGNDCIREVNGTTGVITTVAGSGTYGYSGDGSAATSAELNSPEGVAVDNAGDLFIADTGNNVIREVDLATGVISTVTGN